MLYTYDDTLWKVKYFENCRVHAGTGYLVALYLGTYIGSYLPIFQHHDFI